MRHISLSSKESIGFSADDVVFQMHIPILKRTVIFSGVDWARLRGEGKHTSSHHLDVVDHVYDNVMAASDSDLHLLAFETDEQCMDATAPVASTCLSIVFQHHLD